MSCSPAELTSSLDLLNKIKKKTSENLDNNIEGTGRDLSRWLRFQPLGEQNPLFQPYFMTQLANNTAIIWILPLLKLSLPTEI